MATVHISVLAKLPADRQELVKQAELLAGVQHGKQFNLIRFDHKGQGIAFLNYPGFFEEAFPVLLESWKIDVGMQTVKYRSFAGSKNPPILHRKELFLKPDDKRRKKYEQLTKTAEKLGLFDDPAKIGFQK